LLRRLSSFNPNLWRKKYVIIDVGTAKKSIMAGIITKLFDYLKEKVQKASYD